MPIKNLPAQFQSVLTLFKQFQKHASIRVLLVLGLMCVSSVTSGIGILFIVPLLESIGISIGVSSGNDIGARIQQLSQSFGIQLSLERVLAFYVVLVTLAAFLSYQNTVLSTKLQRSFTTDLRLKIYHLLLNAQWQYFSSERVSYFSRMVTSQVQAISFGVHQLLLLCSTLILIGVYLLFSLYLSPLLTLLALVCSAILAAILWPLNRRIHRSGKAHMSAHKDIFQSVMEQLGSLKIIKSFAAETKFYNRMQVTSKRLEEQEVRISQFNALTRFVNFTGAALIFAVLFYVSIRNIGLPISNLLVTLFIFSRLMPQVSNVQATLQRLIHLAPEYDDLTTHILNLDRYAENLVQSGPENTIDLEEKITLSGLSYRYPGQDRDVFTGLNAMIAKNQTVALVGPSGIGKSTLADIIAGLVPPTSGSFKVDGRTIDDHNRMVWRHQVAYVTQEVFLFHDTVRSNLNWVSDKNLSDPEIGDLLRLAAAEDFVRALPEGLDTIIGDRGVKLSGGERQRLALARALISQPDILILDEATSALDRENEIKIRDALSNLHGRLTIVVIAHNETTIEHADLRIDLTKFGRSKA